MENFEMTQDQLWRKIEKSQRRGKIMGGLLIIAAGSLFLARELGALIPAWIFTWKMLLIGIGIVLAVKHKFMHAGWLVLVGVGTLFLLNDFYPDMHIRPILWPVLLILVGLFIIFKPRHRHSVRMQYWKKWHEHHQHHRHHHGYRGWDRYNDAEHGNAEPRSSDEDYIESTSIMGGVKKNILSKKFKGGEVVNIFGGAHIDLTQADFEGSVTLDVTQIFGGTKLLVPAHWEIKSQTTAVCGGIEDKRPQPTAALNEENRKVLVLIGTTVFGGIEIKTY